MPFLASYVKYIIAKFKDEKYFTKYQVAQLPEIDERTIDRYLSSHNTELAQNGCVIIRGNNLRIFKELIKVDDMNVVDPESIKVCCFGGM